MMTDPGDLPAGTPRVHVHEKCGEATEMPIDAIRVSLQNPFALNVEPTTHCSFCNGKIPWRTCFWKETNQNCLNYLDDLRGKRIVEGNDPRSGRVPFNVGYPIGLRWSASPVRNPRYRCGPALSLGSLWDCRSERFTWWSNESGTSWLGTGRTARWPTGISRAIPS
jgi:hypothetical protein